MTQRLWLTALLLLPTLARADNIFSSGFETCAVPTSRFTQLPWSQYFISNWPSHPGGVIEFNDTVDITYALEFTATATTFGYGALFAQEVLDSDEGAIAMSISTVPGCVNPAFIPPLCYVDGIQPTLGWKTTGNADYCQLTIGQRYYLNFTYGTRSTPGPAPFCVGSCRRRILSFVQ